MSGKEHRMHGWIKFDRFFEDSVAYTEVSEEYGEWCEEMDYYNTQNNTYTTYQDAIDALELFIEQEEKQLS